MSSQVSKENTTLAILNSINYHMRVTDAHMLNEKQEQEDVCIAILQYLWEQFRGEVGPCSSAQHAGVDSYRLCLTIHRKNQICALKIFFTVAALLFIPAVWHSHNESGEDRNQEQTPPTWSSSKQQFTFSLWLSGQGRLLIVAPWPALVTYLHNTEWK